MYTQEVDTDLGQWNDWTWGTAAMQTWAEWRHCPFAPSEAQNANNNCSVCQEKEWMHMAMWQVPWKDPEHSW